MKKAIKILKPVQSYVVDKTYRVSSHFADMLIARGQATLLVKEEKRVIETKEEKFIPETKVELSISKLRDVITELSAEELIYIANFDNRVSAVNLAKKELSKR